MVSVDVRGMVDGALEALVVPSFTRIGPLLRSRVDRWLPLDRYHVPDRSIVVTGGTSGLGRAAAEAWVRAGADVTIVGRSEDRVAAVVDELRADSQGSDRPGTVAGLAADVGDLDQVAALAGELRSRSRLDVLVHNAGALLGEREQTAQGFEATTAAQVYGPFRLTAMLLEPLRRSAVGRVVTMTSGGMYTQPLTVDDLEMSADSYRGSVQYARAKRAQVTLNEMWAEREPRLRFHAVHPGWADTPGVRDALPTFRVVTGPLLRSAAQGADTMAWLALDDGQPRVTSGRLWLDRRTRSTHRTRATAASDTRDRRRALWERCVEVTGALDEAMDPG